MSIVVTINVGDDSPIVQALSKMMLNVSQKAVLFDSIGHSLAENNRLRFTEQTSPDGALWVQSYRAKSQGGETLRDTGRLMNSIVHAVGGDIINVGTNIDYAHALHYGAVIQAKGGGYLKFKTPNGFAQKKQITLPSREYLGINANDETAVLDIINQFFQV